MTRILVIGRNGQVGWELKRALRSFGEVIATGRDTLDLTDLDAVRNCLRTLKPSIVVNAAAYTAVDRAESEPELAYAVNALSPGILAEEAKKLGAVLVHYSTDFVFDGTKRTPYIEDDEPKPVNEYGRSKLAGERAVADAGFAYLILRTSWIYGGRGNNFLKTVLKLANERDELRIVDDQFGVPNWSRMVADVTGQILFRFRESPDAVRERSGIYHLTAVGKTSWYGFAKRILDRTTDVPGRRTPRLIGIGSADYPTRAQRPSYSVLSAQKLHKVFGITTPAWENMLDTCLAEMTSESSGDCAI